MIDRLEWFPLHLLVVYGWCGSHLFRGARIALLRSTYRFGPGVRWLLTSLVYCPACFGFWAAFGLVAVRTHVMGYEHDVRFALWAAALTVLLRAKLAADDIGQEIEELARQLAERERSR